MAEPNIKDIAYRGLASALGGPVDLATMVMRPFGYSTPDTQVVGGSEWIGKKMEDVGLVSSARAPVREFLASMVTPGGIAKGAALAAPAIGGMFIGKGARTWDALAAARAKDLEKAGLDARTIWQQTGTWKGLDGKWRQEISDAPAKITDDVFFGIKEKQRFEGPMSQALSHQDLYSAYPDTGKIQSGFYAWKTPEGSYQSKTDTITAGGPGTTSQKSAALHELQHSIQQREGFASGGSPSTMVLALEKLADQKRQKAQEMFRLSSANDPLDPLRLVKPGARKKGLELEKEARSLDQKAMDAYRSEQAKFDLYQRLAGEAEARATQSRMNLTQEQRRATFPEESYDVPINELIIRYD